MLHYLWPQCQYSPIVLNSPSQSQQLTQAIFWSVFPPSNQCHPQFHIQGRTRSLLPNVFSLHYRSEVFKTHIKNEAQKLLPFLVETNSPLKLIPHATHQTSPLLPFRFLRSKRIESGIFPGQRDQTLARWTGPDELLQRIQTSASEKQQKTWHKVPKKNKFYFVAIQNFNTLQLFLVG